MSDATELQQAKHTAIFPTHLVSSPYLACASRGVMRAMACGADISSSFRGPKASALFSATQRLAEPAKAMSLQGAMGALNIGGAVSEHVTVLHYACAAGHLPNQVGCRGVAVRQSDGDLQCRMSCGNGWRILAVDACSVLHACHQPTIIMVTSALHLHKLSLLPASA